MNMNCQQLATKMSETRENLDKLSRKQDEKANGDAVGVFLLGIPFSKLSGDYEGDIARLKGEVEALQTAQVKVGCGGHFSETMAPSTLSVGDAEKRLALLTELKSKGLLTDAEFASRKRQLVDEVVTPPPNSSVSSRPGGVTQFAGLPNTGADAPFRGLRITIRDSDPYTGVTASESDLYVSSATVGGGYELNGGALVLDRKGNARRGTLPGLALAGLGGGILRDEGSTLTTLGLGSGAPAADVKVSVIGEGVVRVSGSEIPTVRVRVDGYSPLTTGSPYGQSESISGEVMVEPNTGVILSGRLSSRASQYSMVRAVIRAQPQ